VKWFVQENGGVAKIWVIGPPPQPIGQVAGSTCCLVLFGYCAKFGNHCSMEMGGLKRFGSRVRSFSWQEWVWPV